MIKYPFRQVGDADKRQKFEIEIVQLWCVYCDSVWYLVSGEMTALNTKLGDKWDHDGGRMAALLGAVARHVSLNLSSNGGI